MCFVAMTVSRHGVDAMKESRWLGDCALRRGPEVPRFLNALRDVGLDKTEKEIGPVFAAQC